MFLSYLKVRVHKRLYPDPVKGRGTDARALGEQRYLRMTARTSRADRTR